MNIATQGGKIIVKDGKLAEGCDCCGGVCVCDATAVTVSVTSGNFLRHLLLQNSFGAESKVSLGYIAEPSSGVHILRKDTVAPEAGISPSKWVSNNVPSPGSGRITAVVYRPSGTSAVRVTVGIPVFYWRSVGDSFKSLDEMIAESNGGTVLQQGFGTLVVELVCDSHTGTTRVLSYAPGVTGGGWSPDGSEIPFTACDFTSVNAVLGGSVWWEGAALRKGQERLISQGMNIVSDTRTGNNIVTLNAVELTCCEDEAEGACCEGTTCSVKPACQCQGAGQVFKGVGTVCTPNPCDTTCKPCENNTQPSKNTVTAIVDNVTANQNSPFTAEQLKSFFEGTYVLDKTDVGAANLVFYTFGGWPVQVGSRYADMVYDCRTGGNAFIGDPTTCTVIYKSGSLVLTLFCYASQGTALGNVCSGSQQRVVGLISYGNQAIGEGRMTVS
jgi:hypothetical protein